MTLNSLSIDLSTCNSNLKLEDIKNVEHIGEKKKRYLFWKIALNPINGINY